MALNSLKYFWTARTLELTALKDVPMLCIYGEGETDSICPELPPGTVSRLQVGKGHHFSGEYALLADRILSFTRTSSR